MDAKRFPSLRQIGYFVSTAEHGQISQAAVDLSISQSAVTSAIKDLELLVGHDLFVRSAHGMQLTPAGRQFLFQAYDILSKVQEAISPAIPSSDFEGRLTVAATYTVVGYFLPHHLDRLHRTFPSLDIQLFELTRDAIEEGLLSNRYDIGLLLTSNVVNPDLSTEPLISSRRRLWVPAKHPLLTKRQVGLREISQEPYIMLTVDEAAHTAMKYWSATSYRPQIKLRTSSTEAVRSMVANGQGVAILSDMVHRPWSLEGKRIETIVPQDLIPQWMSGWRGERTYPLRPPWRRSAATSITRSSYRRDRMDERPRDIAYVGFPAGFRTSQIKT
jgi:DNA-binding transcriptional LysR family regulator